MYRIWSERPMPEDVARSISDIAVPVGSADLSAEDPFASLPSAQAAIASILPFDGPVMDRAPDLRVVARTGIGVDRVDLAAATERGIAVCNTPDGPTISTAEHTIALMLAVAKRVKEAEHRLAEGGTTDFYAGHHAVELAGRWLGLMGLGRVGRRVARAAQALDMEVVAHDPGVDSREMAEVGVKEAVSPAELLATADVISLHMPLTDATFHVIDGEALANVKPGAILINTARGGLVDEEALLAALDEGRLAGAGLDVTDPEPAPPGSPLLGRDDVVVTPHVAAATGAARERIYRTALEQALAVLRGDRPSHLVNPDVWEHRKPPPQEEET